jgi:hypothetical protein
MKKIVWWKIVNLDCSDRRWSLRNTGKSFPYSISSRIAREKKEFWHSRFTIISIGEPFLCRDEGKGIMDLARAHDDNFF